MIQATPPSLGHIKERCISLLRPQVMNHNQKPRNTFCVYLVVCWRRSSYDKHTSLHLQPTSIPRTSLVMSLWAWPIYPLLWLCSLLVLKTRFLDKIKMRKWSATKNDEWHLWTSLGVNRRKGNIQVKHHKFSLENEKKKGLDKYIKWTLTISASLVLRIFIKVPRHKTQKNHERFYIS